MSSHAAERIATDSEAQPARRLRIPGWIAAPLQCCGLLWMAAQLLTLRILTGAIPMDVLMNCDDAFYALLSVSAGAGHG